MNSLTPISNARFHRIVISALSVALICFTPLGIEQAQAVPTVKIQKKSGGSRGSSKSRGGSMSHGHAGGNHAGHSRSGGNHAGHSRSGGNHAGHSRSGSKHSSQGRSYSSLRSHSHAGHSHSSFPSYRSNYHNTQPYYRSYNSNFRSPTSNYRSYNSNYRSYPSRSYLSVSPYGLSFGYGGVGVSSYYRPTNSYYSYRGALPYGYGSSSYYPRYNSYSTYRGYQPYSSPYSSGYVPAIATGLTPTESSATSQLFDGQVNGPPTAGIDVEVFQVTTNAAARSFQQRAEQAFKQGDYAGAQEQSQQALSLDPDNGRLMLFVSQANYANGNFSTAAELVLNATDALPADQWGFVAGNFRTFYGRNDYVSQTDRLSRLIIHEPENAQALALRGYHYGALGYPDAASRDFQQALKLDPDNGLAKRLLPAMGLKESTAMPEEIQLPTPAEIVSLTAPQS